MTDFEKKLKRSHQKKFACNPNPDTLMRELDNRRASETGIAERDFARDFNPVDKVYNFPKRPRNPKYWWTRLIAGIIAILVVILLTIIARTYWISGTFWSIIPEGPRSMEVTLWRGNVDGFEYSICRQNGEKYALITGIGKNAGKSEITIPGKILGKDVYIGEKAFKDNDTLVKVTFDEGVKTIRKNAFEGCSNLSTISLSETIERVEVQAFANCTSLQNVEVLSDKISYLEGAFLNCTSLATFDFSNVEYISLVAFKGCTSLKSVEIEGLISIGTGAFEGCEALESVRLGEGTRFVSVSAFNGCISLNTLYLPSTLEEIQTNVQFSDSLKTIYYNGSKNEFMTLIDSDIEWLPAECVVYCTDGEITK